MLTAHTSFWSKLEQTEYEKWLRPLGWKHIQGFHSQDYWRYVDFIVCVCICARMHGKAGRVCEEGRRQGQRQNTNKEKNTKGA